MGQYLSSSSFDPSDPQSIKDYKNRVYQKELIKREKERKRVLQILSNGSNYSHNSSDGSIRFASRCRNCYYNEISELPCEYYVEVAGQLGLYSIVCDNIVIVSDKKYYPFDANYFEFYGELEGDKIR